MSLNFGEAILRIRTPAMVCRLGLAVLPMIALAAWAAETQPLMATAAVASSNNEPAEGVEIKIGADWKQTFTPESRKFTAVKFVPEGMDAHTSKEIVTILNLGAKRKSTPEQLLNAWKFIRDKECPRATQFTVIAQNENSILYEWQDHNCKDHPAHHAVERILSGGHDLFMLQYLTVTPELAPEIRERWVKTFSDATLDSGPDALAPQAGTAEVNELVPFPADKISVALKTAMESNNCNVKEATAERIECKRPRDYHYDTSRSSGGEAVTAKLETQGAETLVHISTGKGYYGRLVKQDWSSRIYEDMVRNLQKPQQ